MAEHGANWDLMSAAGSVAAIDDPVRISSGETGTNGEWSRKEFHFESLVVLKCFEHAEIN